MSYTVTSESFKSLAALYEATRSHLRWEPLFILPVWLEAWWNIFGDDRELSILAIKQENEIIGIAPLMIKDGTTSIIGSIDVCDYLDFIIFPGKEQDFFNLLLDDLKKKGINNLHLESLRPESTVIGYLTDIAINRGYEVSITPDDVTLEMKLPSTWDGYLAMLNTKQRHEVRRKLRRLEESGKIEYRSVTGSNGVNEFFDSFLRMFTESRADKADFLTEKRDKFFRVMADKMSEAGILKLGILEVESVPAAMIMYFDYNDNVYLYNSGYEPEYNDMSAGLMSKVLCIRDSIISGRKVFDFLKGDEVYKSRLGGIEKQLFVCHIGIK